jgi:peptidoglycan/xylan/chitin deacetylase (PgdA/CDA1 family)
MGLYRLARGLTRVEPRILMYHRFGTSGTPPGVPAQVFREQLQILQRQFRIVTLAELASRLETNELEPGLAVITVDDGYEDFRRVAFPILEDEGVPATFFVTTGFIDKTTWLWPDVLEYAIEHSAVRQPDFSCFGIPQTMDLDTTAGKAVAWKGLVDALLDLAGDERSTHLAAVARNLEVAMPAVPDEAHAPVSWDDIREMSRAGIEIGAHTLSHPRLTRLSDDELQREIIGSKRRIEDEIGQRVTSFCYPNGAPADYDDRVADAVRSAGFNCAVVAHFDGQRGDRFRLRRLGVGNNMFQFRKSLAGVEHIGRRVSNRRSAVA